MEIDFTKEATEHLKHFKKANDPIILKKIRQLLEVILETPYSGIGKPEALKHHYSGFWSRRINNEHRLVYRVFEEEKIIIVYSLKGHY
ncbi:MULTISPECIES: Txe/YoeB family addiction module toxin [unclassified Flavobacterium]|jgi:toxin YoeB|uniref:Txe/YoeB family addiction module toxin n=1 Tax=unclassified Flavobacterium TaxID=196869 RepID=UPI0025C46C0B|nr:MULTISPECIES: Txe/YoeB family addiction module toxin [unclassified Flavobacterium]